MKTLLLMAVGGLWVAAPGNAQVPLRAPTVRFETRLRGPGQQVGNAVIELAGGGFLVAGYGAHGPDRALDAFLVKFTPAGDTLWRRWYGGAGDDFAWDVKEAPNGDYTFGGFTTDPATKREDAWVVRTDSTGAIRWERKLGGALDEEAWAIEQLTDGDLVLLAQTNSFGSGKEDVLLARFRPNGDSVSVRTYGGPESDRGFGLVRSDSGFVIAGSSRAGRGDRLTAWIFDVADDGRLRWEARLAGEADAIAHGITRLSDGTLLVTGYGKSGQGSNVARLTRLARDGRVISQDSLSQGVETRAMMTTRTASGALVTVGYARSPSSDWDIHLIGSDPTGRPRWQWVMIRPGPARGVMAVGTRDGDVLVTGTEGFPDSTDSELVLMKLTPPRQ